jgi:glycosyltransferase involved in cell wall biosynthesis
LKELRILQVLPRYAPAWSYGGGVRMFWGLANELARLGHEIRVVTSDSLDDGKRTLLTEEQLAERIHVSRFRNRFNRLSAHFGGAFYRPAGMRKAIEAAAAWADVVHMGESRGLHNVWSAHACQRSRAPLVWSAYGGLPEATGIRGVYRAAYDLSITRSIIPRVHRFIAQTQHEREVFVSHGASAARIRLIPLAVTWSDFEDLPARGQLRRRLGLGEKDQVVLSVARLSPVKGLDMLIRSFAQLPRTAEGPFLVLVGWDHGAESSLRALARDLRVADRVIFAGSLLGEDRKLAYVDADVFALAPRVFEETSLAGLEAAACGIPTVLTSECEIPGLVEAGGGLVVARDDAALAAGIGSLLGDVQLRSRTGRAAREAIRERFTIERVAAMHDELFQELVSA